MAKERGNESEQQSPASREQRGGEQGNLARRGGAPLAAREREPSSPFSLMRRFIEDLDRLFVMPRASGGMIEDVDTEWEPAVEMLQRNGELVVRAEVPGIDKDHIDVEVEDDRLVISGERRQEHEERKGGFFRSERVYGRFHRVVPLPEGADAEHAKAKFDQGVLEITMPVAAHRRGHRVEVQDASGAAPRSQPSSQESRA